MAQKEIILGLQDPEKLKEDGRILEAFVILINWLERNMLLLIYYYDVISKKDESKIKESRDIFKKMKYKKSRISEQAYIEISNLPLSQQKKIMYWATISRLWTTTKVWENFKMILRKIGKEFQLEKDVDQLINDVFNFREMRGKVIHRLLEERLTNKEVEKYYEIGKKINPKVEHLLFKCLPPDSRVDISLQKR